MRYRVFGDIKFLLRRLTNYSYSFLDHSCAQLRLSHEINKICQACFLDVFPALEVSGFAGNLRFLEILP